MLIKLFNPAKILIWMLVVSAVAADIAALNLALVSVAQATAASSAPIIHAEAAPKHAVSQLANHRGS